MNLAYQTQDSQSVRTMFNRIAKRYDLTNQVISFGMYNSWQRQLVGTLPLGVEKVALDVATGTGALIPDLESRYGTVFGVDFSEDMLALAKANHATLEIGDAHNLRFDSETFDVVTVSYGVRNFADRKKGLQELARVLKPGGSLHIQEFGQPKVFPISALYKFYSKFILPYLGGMLSGDWNAYRYLPTTANSFPCGTAFANELKAVGLQVSKVKSMCFGVMYLYVAHKPN